MNLAKVHVLNEAEQRYAEFLKEEFGKNNRSLSPALSTSAIAQCRLGEGEPAGR